MRVERLGRAAVLLVVFLAARSPLRADVVINEIHYHPRSDLRDDEFIELHNTGAGAVDVGGWSFVDGIVFTFPAGAVIGPGAFLVVARDAARIADRYGLPPEILVGDYTGALSNGGERIEVADAAGRSVDIVTYGDDYPWSEAADGEGPSLELIDPSQPRDTPRNWSPSRNRVDWVEIVVRGKAASSRLYLYLEGAGECVIDDLRITEVGSGVNLFPGGGFETDRSGWRMTGNHSGSRIDREITRSGGSALHIIATGPGQGAGASAYRELGLLVPGREYEIRLWARPIGGNGSLITRVAGGGIISRKDIARLEGTPGRENASRSDNLPPLVGSISTDPVLPAPGEAVTLLAKVLEEDLVEVVGRVDDGDGVVTVVLRDDGRSGDGLAGDGLFGAGLPPAPEGTIVEYRVAATDTAGQRSETPPRQYPVARFDVESELPVYSIFIRDRDWTKLKSNIWTETYFPAVFVHDGEIFSNAGLRFRGGVPRFFRKKSLKVRLPDDHLFEGRDRINLNAAAMDDDYITEPLAYWLYDRVGVEASKTRFARVELNGEFWGLFIDVEQVDERYLRLRGLDPDGALYKSVGVAGSLRKLDGVVWNGQEFSYLNQYEKKTREDEPHDDLIGFINGLVSTPKEEMEAYLDANLEVEQFINYLAVSNLMCIWDNIQHNYYMYRDTEGTGKWRVLPWDNDHAWGEWGWNYFYDDTYHRFMGTRSHPFAGAWYAWNQLWTDVLDVPRFREMYLDRQRELLNTHFAEGPVFRKLEEYRAAIESTVLLDELKWPDDLESLHTGPKRTMAEEIPLLRANFTRRRRFVASRLGVQLIDVPADGVFRRGDCNDDGRVDISDALCVLDWLFLGGTAPGCVAVTNTNGDAAVNISDAVYLLDHLFLGGPAPVDPFPGCGTSDLEADAELGCDAPGDSCLSSGK